LPVQIPPNLIEFHRNIKEMNMIKIDEKSEKIWEEFKRLGKISLSNKRLAQKLIPALYESKIYQKHGFATLIETASKLAGIGGETVRRIVSTHNRTENLPKLREAMQKFGYDKVYTVLGLMNFESEEKLAKMVAILPKEALREKVRELRYRHKHISRVGKSFVGNGVVGGYGFQDQEKLWSRFIDEDQLHTFRISIKADARTMQDWNRIKAKLEKKVGHPLTQRAVLKYLIFQVSLKSLEEVVAATKRKAIKYTTQDYERAKTNKTLTAKHKSYIKQLNHGICQVKGCNRVATEIHHPKYQALNPNNHQNLRALCKIHHQLEHTLFSSSVASSVASSVSSSVSNSMMRGVIGEPARSIKHLENTWTDEGKLLTKSWDKRKIDKKIQKFWHLE